MLSLFSRKRLCTGGESTLVTPKAQLLGSIRGLFRSRSSSSTALAESGRAESDGDVTSDTQLDGAAEVSGESIADSPVWARRGMLQEAPTELSRMAAVASFRRSDPGGRTSATCGIHAHCWCLRSNAWGPPEPQRAASEVSMPSNLSSWRQPSRSGVTRPLDADSSGVIRLFPPEASCGPHAR
eukprot:scaffold208517_cov31-Tisochrysis_lutea.AAC.2